MEGPFGGQTQSILFSCPIVLFLCYPSMVGAFLLSQSLLCLDLSIHSLCHRLSLVADNVSTGCRVVVVELLSRIV